jgi:hypothetical protein
MLSMPLTYIDLRGRDDHSLERFGNWCRTRCDCQVRHDDVIVGQTLHWKIRMDCFDFILVVLFENVARRQFADDIVDALVD